MKYETSSTTVKPRPTRAPYTKPSMTPSNSVGTIKNRVTTPISLSVSSTPGPTIAGPHWAVTSRGATLLMIESQAPLASAARVVAMMPPHRSAARSSCAGSRSKRSSRYTIKKTGMA